MKISRDEKKKNASEILRQIHDCKTEEDLERVDDFLEVSVQLNRIYKKAYKFLSEELDNQSSLILESSL